MAARMMCFETNVFPLYSNSFVCLLQINFTFITMKLVSFMDKACIYVEFVLFLISILFPASLFIS